MKTGKSLIELATEISRQNDAKKDYIADTRAIQMVVRDDGENARGVELAGFNGSPLAIQGTAHAQIAGKIGVPKVYYDRMRAEAPELLAANVNHWFNAQPGKQMVRTLDGKVRGFLSDRFRAWDNYDLLNAAFPVLQGRNAVIQSCEVTEKHFFLKATFPELSTEIPCSMRVGDIVDVGFSLRNSEIGFSSLAVEPFFNFRVCTNGMISNHAQRKYHVGKRADTQDAVEEILRNETRDMRDTAFWMQIQDVLQTVVSRDIMMQHVEQFTATTRNVITADPVKVVEVARRTFALSEAQGGGILQHFLKSGDMSQWGLINAVTRTAQDQADYEDATMLERLGGQIVELAPKDWSALIKQAA